MKTKRVVRVKLVLEVERDHLEALLGFHLEDCEWDDLDLLATLILENPKVIPKLCVETSVDRKVET